MKSKDQGNEGFTGLGATLGGITLATVVLFLIYGSLNSGAFPDLWLALRFMLFPSHGSLPSYAFHPV